MKFNDYKPYTDYVWIAEVNSSLSINDDFNTLINLSDITLNFIDGLGVKLQSNEETLNGGLDFTLRSYIDFSDLGNLGFELLIKARESDTVIIGLTFVGAEHDGELYIDLSGLGYPKVYMSGIDLGAMLIEILQSLEASAEAIDEEASGGGDKEAANAAGSISGSVSGGDEGSIKFDTIESAPLSANLLMVLADENLFNIAITGALILNLVGTLTDALSFLPDFANVQLGYEKDKLSGLKLVVDEQQHFNIAYNFERSYSYMVPKMQLNTPVYAEAKSHMVTGTTKEEFIAIDQLKNLYLSLELYVNLNTVNENGYKSDAVEDFEELLENILGLKNGAIDFQFQDSYVSLLVTIEALLDITDISNTYLKVQILYNDEVLLGVYHIEGRVYVDLSGVGFFKSAINGIDIASIINGMLYGTPINLTEEGLDLRGLLLDSLKIGNTVGYQGSVIKTGSSITEASIEAEIELVKKGYLDRYNKGEFENLTGVMQQKVEEDVKKAVGEINVKYDGAMTQGYFDSVVEEIMRSIGLAKVDMNVNNEAEAKKIAFINVLLYNDSIKITPTSEALGNLLGVSFPMFENMTFSMDLDDRRRTAGVSGG